MGEECSRKLWYTFRWYKAPDFSGRMQRLFNRGHREEARFLEWLGGIDCEVLDADEEQTRMVAVAGHFGGSRDGSINLTRYGLVGPFLVEFKTHNTGAGWNTLTLEGVANAQKKHWVQMCIYGYAFKIQYAVYFSINKNDDDLHVEVVALDWELGRQQIERGGSIIRSTEVPPRIQQVPEKYPCKYCDMRNVCFNFEAPDKNCRSCAMSRPEADKQWVCVKWNTAIPPEQIKLEQHCWTAANNG